MVLHPHEQVFKGRCKLFDEIVAIKRLDLDSNWDLVRILACCEVSTSGLLC
jgi:hypothetical protein